MRRGWLYGRRVTVAILLALILVACGDSEDQGGTTVADGVTTTSSTTEPSPSTTSEAPSTTQSASATTQEPGAGRDDVTIGNDQEHRTTEDGEVVRCEGGGEVDVANDAVTVSGVCEEIDVLVDGISLTIESTDDLDIESDDTTVEADEVRELDIDGNGNQVTVGTVRDIDVDGNDNIVTFGGGDPEIDDEGTGNTISAN